MDDEREHQTGVGMDHWGAQFPDTRWSILITRQDLKFRSYLLGAIVSRMRKRFKVLLREQVSVSVSPDEEIDSEIRPLLGAFS